MNLKFKWPLALAMNKPHSGFHHRDVANGTHWHAVSDSDTGSGNTGTGT